ncbi:glycosyl hydrolase [Xylariaceae sp. FL0016]|nr:glycosyl hydrolase [Xylariaceae sp. FL0016]
MYFSAEVEGGNAHHCVGTATASAILGPWTASDTPFACNLTIGGAIDASGFRDVDGKRYVTYKVDGNSIGHGGTCNNEVAPIVATPLILQEVEADGVTKVGEGITILDRTDADGPLVEAPSIMRSASGIYTLFFSSGCFTESSYNVNYATSKSVRGPYTRAATPIATTGQYSLSAPGGATGLEDGEDGMPSVAFHADCDQGRCMHTSRLMQKQTTISLVL